MDVCKYRIWKNIYQYLKYIYMVITLYIFISLSLIFIIYILFKLYNILNKIMCSIDKLKN